MVYRDVYIENITNHIKVGIIGSTNIGKSTLFNVLSRASSNIALCENSLFTTIDINATTFTPKDTRYEYLEEHFKPILKKPSKITVMDTAGVVHGSFRDQKGVGLSSLEALLHADVLLHLIRAFESDDNAHYDEVLDPMKAMQTVNQELLQMVIRALRPLFERHI